MRGTSLCWKKWQVGEKGSEKPRVGAGRRSEFYGRSLAWWRVRPRRRSWPRRKAYIRPGRSRRRYKSSALCYDPENTPRDAWRHASGWPSWPRLETDALISDHLWQSGVNWVIPRGGDANEQSEFDSAPRACATKGQAGRASFRISDIVWLASDDLDDAQCLV